MAHLAPGGDWVTLTESVDAWRAEGAAEWEFDDGVIIGKQGAGGAAGDLYTKQQWADFELEGEFKMKWPGNSGIWFRRSPEQPGYQMDVLDQPNYPTTFSGSLYAMGRAFIAENSDRSTIREDDWNQFRIRAVGDQITITLNGTEVVNIRDDVFTGPGSIGIQVHKGEHHSGMEFRLRNARIRGVQSPSPAGRK